MHTVTTDFGFVDSVDAILTLKQSVEKPTEYVQFLPCCTSTIITDLVGTDLVCSARVSLMLQGAPSTRGFER